MPFQVNRWCCDFCKRFVRADKAKVELHEITCFNNVERASCKMCQEEYWDEERKCSIGLLENTLEEKYKDIGIRWKCPGFKRII